MYLAHCLIAATLAGVTFPAAGSEIRIIANESIGVSQISNEELQRVFLVKTSALRDGSYVTPVLALGSDIHQQFIKQYLGKTDAALSSYYRSLVFTGKAFMPKFLHNDAETVAYVAKTKGAMGYVSADAAIAGVKSLTIR